MTDTMCEALAQLMGAQRAKEEGRDLPLYNHHSVCRPYLLSWKGLFSCRKMHEPTHKADYENAQAQKDHFYDIELYNILQGTIRLVDGEIEKIKNKLDRDTRDAGESAEIVKMKRIADIEEQIKLLGKVEESMRTAKKVEELEQKKNELKNEGKMNIPMTSQQRLRVCDDCGAQLNIMDHESRLADHFGGKMHLGMVEIRERYTEMGSTIDERHNESGPVTGEQTNNRGEVTAVIRAKFMMGLFGKKKDPKEQVRELQRKMRQEMRTLDRQVYSIQREEQKVKNEIKAAAKKGDKDVCVILAKSLLQSRKTVQWRL
ncbi:unnamed protein product, partial [Mesorhabditis belari]|uniref:LUC7-like protein n=1 Tax=Mesorhabditis belari TaxID=2138241 RepID=A0AAF3F9K3_9BILA